MTREEAIKVLEMFLHKQCDLGRTEFAYDQLTIWDAVKMASDALEQELSWIPVAERLPQESKMFLVTLVDKENDYICIDVAWYAHPNDYSIEFGEWREVPTSEKVIAWMQLPEPYKEENEE